MVARLLYHIHHTMQPSIPNNPNTGEGDICWGEACEKCAWPRANTHTHTQISQIVGGWRFSSQVLLLQKIMMMFLNRKKCWLFLGKHAILPLVCIHLLAFHICLQSQPQSAGRSQPHQLIQQRQFLQLRNKNGTSSTRCFNLNCKGSGNQLQVWNTSNFKLRIFCTKYPETEREGARAREGEWPSSKRRTPFRRRRRSGPHIKRHASHPTGRSERLGSSSGRSKRLQKMKAEKAVSGAKWCLLTSCRF